jgi:hypothetical protein
VAGKEQLNPALISHSYATANGIIVKSLETEEYGEPNARIEENWPKHLKNSSKW